MKKISLIICLFSVISMKAQTSQLLYGLTYAGGNYNQGILYQYNMNTGELTKEHDFAGNSTDGGIPFGSLIQATDGKLYGLTSEGGTFNYGTIFSFDPATTAYTVVFSFYGGYYGSYSTGSLFQASNGKLYGMTGQGGFLGEGTIFEYNISSATFTRKISFNTPATGNLPVGSGFIQATDGKLYSMTNSGGDNSSGVIFQFDYSSGTYTTKFAFDDSYGAYPYGSLLQAADGKMYGMTEMGGANNNGVFFQFDPATSTVIKKFDFDVLPKGSYPDGSLVQATDGMLYGMTSQGGINDVGVIFQYDPTTSAYTKKFDFDYVSGTNPRGTLMQASDGKLYGVTNYAGPDTLGTLFQFDPATSVFTRKISFTISHGCEPYYSTLLEVTQDVTGVEPDFKNQFNLYPNPNSGKFNIEAFGVLQTGNGKIEIYNAIGKLVYSDVFRNTGTNEIDLSAYTKGMYFLKIFEKDKIYTSKIITE